jgi:hypothetical protein
MSAETGQHEAAVSPGVPAAPANAPSAVPAELQPDTRGVAAAAVDPQAAPLLPTAAASPAAAEEHPFETDPGDHAETPFEAYEHLEPLLARLAR